MSYILEALKKADQDRDIGAVPGLSTPHEVERPERKSYRWLWVVATLLIVNIVLVAMLLTDRNQGAPATIQAPLERQAPPVNDQAPPANQQSSAAMISKAPVREKAVLPKDERIPSSGGLVVLPAPAMSLNSKPVILREEEVGRPMDTVTTAEDRAQPPSWYELPQAFRNALDLPRLDLHAYSEEPQNRFILVDLKKYREGDRLESGLVLEEVLPDGMVMSYQGERFLVEK